MRTAPAAAKAARSRNGKLGHVRERGHEPGERTAGEDRRVADEAWLEAVLGRVGLRVGMGLEMAAEREQRLVMAGDREGAQGAAGPEGELVLPDVRARQGERLGLVALTSSPFKTTPRPRPRKQRRR